jgi:hypothetical protein
MVERQALTAESKLKGGGAVKAFLLGSRRLKYKAENENHWFISFDTACILENVTTKETDSAVMRFLRHVAHLHGHSAFLS